MKGRKCREAPSMMVKKAAKSSAIVLSAAGRCSLSTIVWSLAAWVLLIHAYTVLFPARITAPEPQATPKRLPMYRELEEIEDMDFDGMRHGANNGHSSPRHRPRRRRNSANSANSAIDDFLNVSSQRRSIYFPDSSLAIDPSKRDAGNKHFYPGRAWRDTEAGTIQAHGGAVLYIPVTRTYYWYGENKGGRTFRASKRATARVDVIGVSCYSSKDLLTWKDEGIVLAAEKKNRTHDLYTGNVLERPKVIYNDRTQQYVMWMHIDDANYTKAFVGVAASYSPIGPFHYVTGGRPHGFDSRDMTLFKDDDGQAYLVYSSEENSVLHVGVLTDDYLDLKRVVRKALVGQHREAPAVFKHRGLYYMITSGCTGWAPNTALVHSAESMFGPWDTLGNPCVGGNENFRRTTFFSQGTFVLPLPGLHDLFLFIADRWNPHDLGDSRYVWLPLTMDGPADEPLEDDFEFPLWSRVSIHWHKKWKLPQGWDSHPPLQNS